MTLEIKDCSDIGLRFEELVLDPFLNKGFNFPILQESRKLRNLKYPIVHLCIQQR